MSCGAARPAVCVTESCCLLPASATLCKSDLSWSGGKYVPPKKGLRSGVSITLSGQPALPVVASTYAIYRRPTSGFSSPSTLIEIKYWFRIAAALGAEEDTFSLTWQPMEGEERGGRDKRFVLSV